MFTFTISTETTETNFNTKLQAQAATRILDDLRMKFKITVNTPTDKEFSFSGINAWAEISEFFQV